MDEVADWRARIDEVDRRILSLLNERARYVLELAPKKRRRGIPVHAPEREREILDKLRGLNRGPLDEEAVARIFETIMREMRAVQQVKA